jgi:hypothetical protein
MDRQQTGCEGERAATKKNTLGGRWKNLDGQWNDERKGIAWCASRRAKTARKKKGNTRKTGSGMGRKEGRWRRKLLK